MENNVVGLKSASAGGWQVGVLVMPQVPFYLRYDLTRLQRLIPHLGVWGPGSLFIPVMCMGIVSVALSESPWMALLLIPMLYIFRGFFIGLLDVVLHRVRKMVILVEENALGYLAGDERWWLFLDGIIDIRKYRSDIWTIQHWNGSVVNVPASQITDDQIEYIQVAAARGRTPEGIQAVIKRGRLIHQIESGDLSEESDGKPMTDIKNPKLIWAKGILFLLLGLLASVLIVLHAPSITVAILLCIAVWAFCRFYYFVFYVIQHYVDSNYRFSGLLSFLRYALSKRRRDHQKVD